MVDPVIVTDDPRPHVRRITLNRPEKRNAMSNGVRALLFDELRRGDQDPDVSVMVIRGAGVCFSSGYDLSPDPNEPLPRPIALRDGFWSRSLVEGWMEMMDMATPIIGQVHGYCLAGGSELAAACDLLYVADDATIGYPPVRTMSSPDLLWQPWFMGMRRAMEAVLTGDSMSGAEAVEAGFANHAFPADRLEAEVLAIAERVAQVAGDLLALNKRSVHRAMEAQGMRTGLRATAELQALGLRQRSSKEYMQKLRADGVKKAVEDRDAPFGDGQGAAVVTALADAVAAVDAGQPEARAELETLVRIPSISADPDRRVDVEASAEATADLLRAHGLEAVRLAGVDGSHPYVIGEWMHAGPDAPTVLLYAHHDVQPPGIVANWESDPFEPAERGGRLYGRGSADDKAGGVAHTHAVSAWLRTSGALPCNVRVLIEGEEEIGSPTLLTFLEAHLDELRSDVLVLADAGNWKVGVPGLTYSLRGLAAADIELRALDGPVHSGMAGGAIPDPVVALARVLASLVDDRGDVAIEGLWDDVRPPTEAERTPIDGLDDDPQAFGRAMGLRPGAEVVGDPGTTLHERLWFRPSLTVIGLDAHPIKGSSNQVIAKASARVSLRLAPGQVPERVVAQLRAHVEQHVPWGLELRFRALEGAPAWQTDPTGPAFDAARHALRAGFGVDAVLMGVGGSIPFVGPFADAFGGIPALLLGPADPHSHIHGENESLHLDDWRRLMTSEVHLLAELAANARIS